MSPLILNPVHSQTPLTTVLHLTVTPQKRPHMEGFHQSPRAGCQFRQGLCPAHGWLARSAWQLLQWGAGGERV